MANPILGQILGSVLGRGTGGAGPFGAGGGGLGGLDSVLGGMLGGGLGGARPSGVPQGGGLGGRNAMLALLLPLAMRWVQRNGGLGNVLQQMGQRGYAPQAASWVGTGQNQPMPLQAVQEVVGGDELAAISQQLGIGQDEVATGFAEILPEMVDHLTPEGSVPPDADQRLDAGQGALDQLLSGMR